MVVLAVQFFSKNDIDLKINFNLSVRFKYKSNYKYKLSFGKLR